jgi:hypothetical protein
VVWTSAEERQALKRMALEAEVSVAQLIGALAHGLSLGLITPFELLTHVRKGMQVMEKIPTMFRPRRGFQRRQSASEGLRVRVWRAI